MKNVLLVLAVALSCPVAAAPSANDVEATQLAAALFSNDLATRRDTLRRIEARGGTDMVAPLIFGLRYFKRGTDQVVHVLKHLTGARPGGDWAAWLAWQQQHPEIVPFDGFDALQSVLLGNIDAGFRKYVYRGVRHEIRLEEIVWGGVRSDGIPALTRPAMIPAAEAGYLSDRDWVFGVAINGDVRAYPYRIMDWHEMLNDVIGGVPVSLAYCTLCGSGILFATRVPGYDEAFIFGSSGLLYRSNKLMFDSATQSLWNQFTGRPVVGPLTASGIELAILPLVSARWGDWRRRHPQTTVLSVDTGFERPYRRGAAYGEYFDSPDLMFPVASVSDRHRPKDVVFGLRLGPGSQSWPLSAFRGGRVINARLGVVDVVVIGDARRREVRAYRADGRRFEKAGRALDVVRANDGSTWRLTEPALVGPDGTTLARLPGHLAYWFAWSGYLGDG